MLDDVKDVGDGGVRANIVGLMPGYIFNRMIFVKRPRRLDNSGCGRVRADIPVCYCTRGVGVGMPQNLLDEQLQNPEFKAEYDALEDEFVIIQAMIDARKRSGLTQKQLAERTGIAQADISKLENGNANPSLKTLRRLAAGMGMKIKLEFSPANI